MLASAAHHRLHSTTGESAGCRGRWFIDHPVVPSSTSCQPEIERSAPRLPSPAGLAHRLRSTMGQLPRDNAFRCLIRARPAFLRAVGQQLRATRRAGAYHLELQHAHRLPPADEVPVDAAHMVAAVNATARCLRCWRPVRCPVAAGRPEAPAGRKTDGRDGRGGRERSRWSRWSASLLLTVLILTADQSIAPYRRRRRHPDLRRLRHLPLQRRQ